MANATTPPTRKSAAPARGTARLTVTINGTPYSARLLPIDPGAGVARAWRLKRHDADSIVASIGTDGRARCECGDFEFRRSGDPSAGPCKHLAALAAVGLLSPTTGPGSPTRSPRPRIDRVHDEFAP